MTKTLQEQLVTEVQVEFVEQHVQRGTGDAMSVALTVFDDLDAEDDILVLPGDAPLVRAETIAQVATEHRLADAAATILTARVPDPHGLGRIVRDKNDRIDRIVEHADATPEELEIDEINTSIYCFRRNLLAPALRRLSPENAQGEYYLTDAIAVLRAAGHKVIAIAAEDPGEAIMVNDRAELADAEAELRAPHQPAVDARRRDDGRSVAHVHRRVGGDRGRRAPVPGHDPRGPHCPSEPGPSSAPTSTSSTRWSGERVRVENAIVREAEIGDDCTVGPFAYLRPGTRLAARAKVGTYVEVKNSEIGEGTKVPHLSYIGDADIGADANLGASTITANYDGEKKHRTTVGDGVHTGIHTSLVAPVEVGDGAETGAGSVVTNDVPPGRLVRGVPARDARAAGPVARG